MRAQKPFEVAGQGRPGLPLFPSARPKAAVEFLAVSMPVVATYLYSNGKREGPVTLADPTAAEELAAVQKNYGLHPLAVEYASNGHQISKLENYGDQLFVLANIAMICVALYIRFKASKWL